MTASSSLPTPPVVSTNRIRPHGVWIVAGGLAVAGLALAGVLTWQAATGTEGDAAVAPATAKAMVGKTSTSDKPHPAQHAAQQAPACATCGVVESVQAIKRKGDASGAGAVLGGVTGAIAGNQVGKGNGRKAMTVLGAVGGGVAGNEIEKNMKATTVYEVTVRMDDGSVRTLERAAAPRVGQRVRMDGKAMVPLGQTG